MYGITVIRKMFEPKPCPSFASPVQDSKIAFVEKVTTPSDPHSPENAKKIEDRVVAHIKSLGAVNKKKEPIGEESARKIGQFVSDRFILSKWDFKRFTKEESEVGFPMITTEDATTFVLTGHLLSKGNFKKFLDSIEIHLDASGNVSGEIKAEERVIGNGKIDNQADIKMALFADDLAKEINSENVIGKSICRLPYTKVKSKSQRSLERAVMIVEKMEGDLNAVVKGGPIVPFRKKLKFALGAAKGLADIHQKGYVHRDVKPENILIKGETVRFCDLDFAIKKSTFDPNQKGTPFYLSPEALCSMLPAPERDNWALGIVLYRLFHPKHKKPYFLRKQNNFPMLMRTIKQLPDRIEKNDLFNDWKASTELEEKLQEVISNLFVKDPTQRYTAQQVADEIQKILDTCPATGDMARNTDRLDPYLAMSHEWELL